MACVPFKKTVELSDLELFEEFLKLKKGEFELPKLTRRKVILYFQKNFKI